MITCEDLQIEQCSHCIKPSVGGVCFVEGYKYDIAHCKSFSDVLKQYKNICNFQNHYKHDHSHSSIYYCKALECYYPFYKEKLDKILVLL